MKTYTYEEWWNSSYKCPGAVKTLQDLQKRPETLKTSILKIQKIQKKLSFIVFRPNLQFPGISSRLYIQLFTQNPNLQPQMSKSFNQMRNIKFSKFSNLVFLTWLKDLDKTECTIGFYVKNCIYSRMEMPGNGKLDRKTKKTKTWWNNFGRQ